MKRVALAILSCTLLAFGGDVRNGNFGANHPEQPSAGREPSKRNSYPFSGELESHTAKSITLKGKKKPRELLLTPDTRILRNGARATLAEAVPGERVSGSTRKNAAGVEEALTVNLKGPAAKK